MSAPKKVMVVFGTRPELIKLAPLILALQDDPRYQLTTVNSGQHIDYTKPLLEWFNITPHHTLNVMTPGQPLALLSGKLLAGLHTLVEHEQPDIMLVQGDTTTAFMAALCAYYAYDFFVRHQHGGTRHLVQVAHVEAGLRTHNNYAPFPEEVNRRLITPIAHWHFAPTAASAQALFNEGIHHNVFITGNTVIDALHLTANRLQQTPQPLPAGVNPAMPCILITGHRRENYGAGFQHICNAIRTLATRYPTHQFVYPVHLNQNVQEPVKNLLGNIPNVILTTPLDYAAFIRLMQHSTLILTDSGGVQEEGPSLGKPVLVMRDVTERPEGIAFGTLRLVGTTEEAIVTNIAELLDNPAAYQAMSQAVNPYGDGHATTRILNLLAGASAEDNTFLPTSS